MSFHGGKVPEYVIFAGVNGVGKSTFYHASSWAMNGSPKAMPRVNSDEILRESHGDWSSVEAQMKASKAAVREIRGLMKKRRSFNQETTLSGRSALKRIEKASQLGYNIRMFYIGIDSPQKAQARIDHREEIGGHGINEDVVKRRYQESLINLSRAVRICNEVIVLDNTINFVEIAHWNKGIISWIGDIKHYGQWLLDAIQDDAVWKA